MRISKRIALIMALLFITIVLTSLFVVSASAATGNTTEFAGGTGTKSDPYIIASKEHLLNVKNHLSSYYKMISDIEFTDDDYSSTGILSNGWNAIGSSTKPFTGYFDGNNHNIIGLKKSSTFSGVLYLGLFGWNEGTIINTNVVDCDFNAVCTDPGHFGAYAGGIVAWNKGTIEHCSSSGIIYGTNGAGGIVGKNYSGSITRSYNFCTVSSNKAGGIVGINDRSVSNCYNTGAISGSTAGGIVGEGWMPSYCYNVGIVNADYYCGGILGYFPSSYSGGSDGSNCYYLDNVTYGVGYISKADLTIKLSSSQMTQKESFEKLDFATIWKYDTSNNYHYPVIKNKIDYSSFFAGGDGTETAPFEISNTEELNNITKDTSAYYKLTCNIVFTDSDYDEGGLFSSGWIPFVFSGVFDGCGYSIINLRVSTVAKTIHTATTVFNCGTPSLFSINNGTIKNLTIEDARYSINAGVYNGGVVCAENNGTITNCHSKNCLVVFNSCNHFGGIVGDNKGTIQNCTSENTITLDSKAGEIGGIASNNSGNIIGCTNRTAIISAGSDYSTTGGIVATNSGKIIQCRNLASISTTSTYQNRSAYSGGIVGSMSAGEITECYNNGLIYAATNKYSSNAYAGGLVGYLSGGKVSNSYNIGNISASNNAYSGIAYVGGLIGYNKTIDDVVNCYSVCQVQGNSSEDVYAGIICGYSSVATIKKCYYVGSASGALGFGDATNIYNVSSEAFGSSATFNNFDFSTIWVIQNDSYAYPQLVNNQHVCHHVFSSTYSNDDNYHWSACENNGCTTTKSKTQHVFDHTCDTTCVCGYVRTITHDFTGAWQKDTAGHWHICKTNGCNITDIKVAHSYDHACDTTCECGYVRTVTHNFTGAWHSDADGHWHICENNGCIVTDTKTAHTPGAAATETEPQKCTVCGYVITPALGHTHNYNTQKHDANKHWMECRCGDKQNETSHTARADDGNCLTAVTCNSCSAVITAAKKDHTPGTDDDNCSTAIICTNPGCTFETTVAKTHIFTGIWHSDADGHWHICETDGCDVTDTKVAHFYDHACDTTCECGYVRTVSHDFTGNWHSDADGHWHICETDGCDITDTKVAHSYDHACDTTCVCGYIRTITHDFTGAWQKDDAGHWHVCANGCGATDSKVNHVSAGEASETNPEVCSICSWEISPALGHTTHTPKTEWQRNDTHHWHECAGCDGQEIEKAMHNDGDNNGSCDTCGHTMSVTPPPHTHAYGTTWEINANEHWNECTCGEKTNKATHIDGDNNSKCDTCNYTMTVNVPEPQPPVNKPSTDDSNVGATDDFNGSNSNVEGNIGLSTRTVVGIAVGSAAVVGIGGFSLIWFVIKKKGWADLFTIFKK